jgi:hypothetical protein
MPICLPTTARGAPKSSASGVAHQRRATKVSLLSDTVALPAITGGFADRPPATSQALTLAPIIPILGATNKIPPRGIIR